jgi:hypothetical protein
VTAAARPVTLESGADGEATFEYRTSAGGILGVNLTPADAFPQDDRAELELPAQPVLPVTVYSQDAELLKPVLSATPRVAAVYRKPEEFRPDDRGLVILDRFVPQFRPTADSIWIDPPAQGSPVPVRTTVEQVAFSGWDGTHPAAAGLHAKDFKLERASVFETGAGDARIGEVAAGPVIVARPGKPKVVVLGFHPALSGMRYELATPLLFANLLRWISPETFRRSEATAGSAGVVKLLLDQAVSAPEVRVSKVDGAALPFALRDRTLTFFSGEQGGVKVSAGDREYLYSLSLPELGDARWAAPAEAKAGIPHFTQILDTTSDLWPWLALLGAIGLTVEWILYGRFRRGLRRARSIAIRRTAAETTGVSR